MKAILFASLTIGLAICSCHKNAQDLPKPTGLATDTMAASSHPNIARLRDSLLKQQARYQASQRLANGKHAPRFRVRLIGTGESVSNATFSGGYYLLHFWGTRCGPCVAEMGKIHEAYAKYKNSNFTILSFAQDEAVSVVEFRKAKWAMPWYNAAFFDNLNNDIDKNFQVYAIPCLYLINPSGVILAQGKELRGERLQPTLAKYIR